MDAARSRALIAIGIQAAGHLMTIAAAASAISLVALVVVVRLVLSHLRPPSRRRPAHAAQGAPGAPQRSAVDVAELALAVAEELEHGAGSQFDLDVVAAFRR